MTDKTATQSGKVLPCPVCGSALNVERLVVEDDHDEVFTFDCPKEDFHHAATRAQLLEVAARALAACVRQEWAQGRSG